jgi:signal peptidase I
MGKKAVIKEIRSWIFTILAALFIVALLNTEVFAKVQVQQHSMENTLFEKQQLIIDKLSYNFTEPKRGDIIIFLENEEKGNILKCALRSMDEVVSVFNDSVKSKRLVKRVIGIAGDDINIKNGYVYVNGKKLEEPYANGQTTNGDFKLPTKVGENKLFVLGDNRSVSSDSRKFGLIHCKQVEGKAIFRVYPFNDISKVK